MNLDNKGFGKKGKILEIHDNLNYEELEIGDIFAHTLHYLEETIPGEDDEEDISPIEVNKILSPTLCIKRNNDNHDEDDINNIVANFNLGRLDEYNLQEVTDERIEGATGNEELLRKLKYEQLSWTFLHDFIKNNIEEGEENNG